MEGAWWLAVGQHSDVVAVRKISAGAQYSTGPGRFFLVASWWTQVFSSHCRLHWLEVGLNLKLLLAVPGPLKKRILL